MTLTDKGEPGPADSIGVTLFDMGNGGTLLFANNWVSNKPLKQILGGGNLIVH